MMFENKIKEFRQLRGLTQDQLAKSIGVAKSTVSMYEAGRREPTFEMLETIADILNASFYDLFGRDERSYIYGSSKPSFPKKIPLLGTIACGIPILADQNIESYIDTPEPVKADFALRCKGDSMINARIFDGDIVYIRQQETVENGEIAAVLIGTEATLKKVYVYPNRIELRAENPLFKPIEVEGAAMSDVKILGKAVWFLSKVQ